MNNEGFNLNEEDKLLHKTNKKVDESLSRRNIDVDEIFPNIDVISRPLIVLFGPVESGKTVVISRLFRYLKKKGIAEYKVNRGFINNDFHNDVIEEFLEEINHPTYAPRSTGEQNFLLIDIYKNQEVYCHLLEAPGEHYFSQNQPKSQEYKTYLESILRGTQNKKIFVVFFEDDMFNDQLLRQQYSERVSAVVKQMNKNDGLIVLYNKIDKNPQLFRAGKVNSKEIAKSVFGNPSYATFKNAIVNNRIKPIWVPFTSGAIKTKSDSGRRPFPLGLDEYPEKLWRGISKTIKPGFFS